MDVLVPLKRTDPVTTLNGISEITGSSVEKNTCVISNGTLIAKDIAEEMNIRVVANGVFLKGKTAEIKIVDMNG